LISRRNTDFLSAAVLGPPGPKLPSTFSDHPAGAIRLIDNATPIAAPLNRKASLPYQVRSPVYPDPVEMSFSHAYYAHAEGAIGKHLNSLGL
jgi:hypothetical protein